MLRLFYAMMVCCSLVLPSLSHAGTVVGSVVTVGGDAQLERAGKRSAIVLNQSVFQSDVILTGAKGRVKLIMADKSKVYIGSRTKISLSKYVVKEKSLIKASLDMAWGKARFFVNKLVSRKSSFEVRTSTAVLGVRGTGWLTEIVNGKTLITQFEGVLSIQTAQGTFSVRDGQVASIDRAGLFTVRPATKGEMSRQHVDPDTGDHATGRSSSPTNEANSGNDQQGNDQQGNDQQGNDQQGNDQQGNNQQGNNQQGAGSSSSAITVVVPDRTAAVLVPEGFIPAGNNASTGGSNAGNGSTGQGQQSNNGSSGQNQGGATAGQQQGSTTFPIAPPLPAPPPVVIQNTTQQTQTSVRIQPQFVIP